ncbi:transketolase [Acidithiobacillus ferrooxidans]|uniref:Transketolase n=1 Tax=Acidithiobacillus ferrivorans TaxID=160808 RepID=A0A1B9BUS1_9PROT|nr:MULTISPECIES: transketolase [Acidithiobacillus]MCR2831709.1 transketolase [Acidithiobacillus ferrooxidans]OCB01413.1 transketolase [Acidithiobacillus ferrivorans]OFA15281.1 transketolase [Acidithiobacillus ferrivorans]
MANPRDQLCINTLRFLSVDMVQHANSGHPGLPLGAAPMAYVLWTRLLKHHPTNPHWFNRDRFVLSAGHGSALLYSLLHLTGYDLALDDIKQFRQWGSKTPGHPERGHTPGVETTTGPLGQGFGNAVGMAIAEAQLAARYNRPNHALIDHHTFAIVSDGDLMEGVASEAASLAGHLKLGKLTCLYDDNYVTLAAATDISFTENRARRFEAYGWHTISVADGNDVAAIEAALTAARAETARPSLILLRTHIGFGSPEQDSFKAHGSPLGVNDVRKTKQKLGWPTEPEFLIPDEALAHFREAVERGAQDEAAWDERMSAYAKAFPDMAEELRYRLRDELPPGWDTDIPVFDADAKGLATRDASGKVMNAIAPKLLALTGGSADLDPSTKTALKGMGDFNPPLLKNANEQGSDSTGWSYAGRNLHFGVREHAMGAIVNGLAAHGGFIPYGSTFLIFSDYMRPAIRLAALMGLHVVHVFTHDSIAVGEDGPTHQPVEQLASLRAIPNLIVIRPGDANETAVAWRVALETRKRPVLLVLTRQALPTLDRRRYAEADGLRRGAYVLRDAPTGRPDLILIASGSEVALVVAAQQKLLTDKIQVRIVSMPSWELFDAQSLEYRNAVLPSAVGARLAVEAGVSQGWHRYVGSRGDVLAVDRFGASAPGELVMREYGFTVDKVCTRAKALLVG